MRTRRFAVLGAALLAAVLAAPACSTPSKGAIILAISTDMQTPKDIDVVSVFVSTNGVPKFDFLGRVLPDGTVALPSTLAIVEPDDPSAQVRIRIVGFQTKGGQENARVLRDVLTTVPHQRTALLHVPISFLDDGSGAGTIPPSLVPRRAMGAPDGTSAFDPTALRSPTCDFTKNLTSVQGVCASPTVDPSKLPDYRDALVFGPAGSSATPQCFPVDQCFASAAAFPTSMITMAGDGSCSFPLSPGEDGQSWNCALATTDGTGTCFGGHCFVPLESDPGQGFTIQPGKAIVMVPGVCKKLQAGATLYIDRTSCNTKVLASPVCEPTQGPLADGGGIVDGAPVDAGGCDGTYTITCASTGTCTGGMATAVVTGATVTVDAPNGNRATGTVDPATCIAIFSPGPACDGGTLGATVDFTQTTTTIPCSRGDDASACTNPLMQCTIARGSAPSDAGPQDSGTLDSGTPPDAGTSPDSGLLPDTGAPPFDSGPGADGGLPPVDAGVGCIPRTCASLGYQCGQYGDGCGGATSICGGCTLPQYCGGGGFGLCGGDVEAGVCIPQSCQGQGIACGPAGDGCGGVLSSCGSCIAPKTCGGGGVPGQCG